MAESLSGAGQAEGVETWRIEKLKPAKLPPPSSPLTLYEGDSYIVLHTFKGDGGKLMHHIHFWQGADTSQDEAAASAIFAVQLDDALGGSPVQFRQVQGHESPEFLQMFKGGVKYERGGVASGLQHVAANGTPAAHQLYHVKGKRNARIAAVPLSVDSLNAGDVFVLDGDQQVFVWAGADSSRAERARAVSFANSLRSDAGKPAAAEVATVEQSDMTSDVAAAFYTLLGVNDVTKLHIKAAADASGDDELTGLFATPQLFRCIGTDAAAASFEAVDTTALSRSMLDSKALLLLVAGGSMWVWLGRECDAALRKGALQCGQRLLEQQSLAAQTPLKIVKQNAEPVVFQQFFADWTSQTVSPTKATARSAAGVTAADSGAADLDAVVAGTTDAQQRDAAHDDIADDGSGTAVVWRIEKMELAEWPKGKRGHFFSGDCFVVQYTYGDDATPQHIVYMWQGRDSTTDEQAACAMHAAKLNSSLGSATTLVRVVQNKESEHFMRVFGGRIIVHRGGKASGFKNLSDSDSYDADGTYLYHIQVTPANNMRAIQVQEAAGALNSGDCFALVAGSTMYVWQGSGSSDAERSHAGKLADELASAAAAKLNKTVVTEGDEPDAFWEAIGGRGEYAKLSGKAATRAARLFVLSDVASGGKGMSVEEVFQFAQDDLSSDDVMLLDTFAQVFVWMGANASEHERSSAADVARRYIQAAQKVDGRGDDCAVTVVKDGEEPPSFTCHFAGWDSTKRSAVSIEQRIADQKAKDASNKPTTDGAAELLRRSESKRRSFNAAPTTTSAATTPERRSTAGVADAPQEPTPSASATQSPRDSGHGRPFLSPTRQYSGQRWPVAPVTPTMGHRGSRTSTSASEEVHDAVPENMVRGPLGKLYELKHIPGRDTLPYEQLKNMALEDGIDPTRREDYLTPEEFEEVFKMPRSDWDGLAAWRKANAKKKAGLF